MKFSKLQQIINETAKELELNAAYGGSMNDGGSSSLLRKFNDYKNNFVIKLDLRPSEFKQLDDIEVGEPDEFLSVIRNYKRKLAENLSNNIQL